MMKIAQITTKSASNPKYFTLQIKITNEGAMFKINHILNDFVNKRILVFTPFNSKFIVQKCNFFSIDCNVLYFCKEGSEIIRGFLFSKSLQSKKFEGS